jgi:hypothetical protein
MNRQTWKKWERFSMFAKMPLQKLENDRTRDPMARSRREELGEMGL